MAKHYLWMHVPAKSPKPKVPDSLKAAVTSQVQAFIDSVLKPRHVEPPPANPVFNYLADIYCKWFRNYCYLCGKFVVPHPHALVPTFETRFARLEYVGNDRFHLSFMRHTGAWVEQYQHQSLAECLATIRDDPFYQP